MVTRHRRQHLQASNDTVTGSGFIQQDHMTGVLCTDTPAFLLHFFQYVAVPHFRARKWNT